MGIFGKRSERSRPRLRDRILSISNKLTRTTEKVKIPTITTGIPDLCDNKYEVINSEDIIQLWRKTDITVLNIKEEEEKKIGYRRYFVKGRLVGRKIKEGDVIVTFPILDRPSSLENLEGKFVVVNEGENLNTLRRVVSVFPKYTNTEQFHDIILSNYVLNPNFQSFQGNDLFIDSLQVEFNMEKSYFPDDPVCLVVGGETSNYSFDTVYCTSLGRIREVVVWTYTP